MKKRTLFILISCFIGLCVFLFNSFYNEARQAAVEKLNQEQMIHAKQAAHGIEEFFGTWTGILNSFALMDEIISNNSDGKRYLGLLYETHKEQIRSVTRVDEKGAILYTVPHSQSIGSNIANQKHMQEILKDHKPVVSDVFKTVQGFDAVALHVPVFRGASFKGTIAIVINFESLAKRYLEVIKVGETGYAWVISRDGTELYSPVSGFTGKSVFENSRDFPSIIPMVQDMLKGHQGTATYTFNKVGGQTVAPVRKHAVYMPIRLGSTFWSIVVASSEDEVLSTLSSFRNRLILVVAVIFLGGTLISIIGVKAWLIVAEEEKRKAVENELRSSEARFHLLIEQAPDAIVVYDVDLDQFVEANASAEKLFGCRRDELLQSGPQRFYPPEQPDQREVGESFSEHNERVLAGEMTQFERTVRSAAGKDLFCEVRLVRLPYENRRLIRASFIDITERKRTEKDLVESERRFRTLFEQAAVGVAEIDPISGRFIHVNKRYRDIVGLSLDEMLKTNFQSITHPDDLEADLKNMKSLMAGEINEFSMDKRYIKKDGGLVWVNLTVYPTWLSGESPTRHIAIVEDITERKQAEEALRARETQLSMIYDGVYDIIFVVGVEQYDSFRFISVNRRFLDATGLPENQVVGRLVKEVIPEPSCSFVLEKYKEAVRSGRSVQWEEVTPYPSGERVGEVSVAPVFDSKRICMQLIGTVHDITERKLSEKALRAAHEELEQKVIERTRELSEANMRLKDLDRLKSMFIASMSHELRTPLNSIIGFSSILRDEWIGALNGEQKEDVSIILRSGKHLLALINDVIDVSKIEAGKIETLVEDFDIHSVIAEAAAAFKKEIDDKRLELKLNAQHYTLHTDRRRLLQSVLNLVGNAVKFTEKGTITVAAAPGDCAAKDNKDRPALSRNGCIEMTVTDTGVGMKEPDLSRLFNAFVRAESTGNVPGTGLGLYLTKKLVTELLKGEITVASEYGRGSTFTMRIPVRI